MLILVLSASVSFHLWNENTRIKNEFIQAKKLAEEKQLDAEREHKAMVILYRECVIENNSLRETLKRCQ